MFSLEEPALLTLGGPAVLVEQPEGTLLGLVALAGQVLQCLATSGLLLPANNPAVLVLHQIGLDETARGVLSGTMEHLSLGASCHHICGHLILWNAK